MWGSVGEGTGPPRGAAQHDASPERLARLEQASLRAGRILSQLLELALRNPIENALRHAPAGTQVRLEVWRPPQAAGISVSDDGQRPDARPLAVPAPPMTTRFSLHWPRDRPRQGIA